MDQVLQGGIQREPCPCTHCSHSSSDVCPPPRLPQDLSTHHPSGQGGQQPCWVLHPRWGVWSSVSHAWMLQACTGCPPTQAPPGTSWATRQRWALPLSTQSLHSSQRAASFCKGHVFNSKLGFQGHRGALTSMLASPLVPLPPPPSSSCSSFLLPNSSPPIYDPLRR